MNNDSSDISEVLRINSQIKITRSISKCSSFSRLPLSITIFVIEDRGTRNIAINSLAAEHNSILIDCVRMRSSSRRYITNRIMGYNTCSDDRGSS